MKMAGNESYEIPESGAVFTFGRSGFADNQQSHFFIRNDPVVEISCGDEHTAVLCQNGRVFLFGHNDYGQLGLGHTRTVTKPSCLKYLKPFHSTHVACGKSHTIVSTDCGRLFSFGSNSEGQLGTGDLSDKVTPQLVNTKHFTKGKISAVSAGCLHSACLTESGELYVWGSNSDGQCGIEVDTNVLIPTKIQFDKMISAVSCGYYHTAFISEENLYTFGEEDSGKLGYKKVGSNNLPKKTEAHFKSAKVVCGGNHTLVLSDAGKVYSCGSNFSGQLGHGANTAESYALSPIHFPGDDIKITEIAAGESHSAFITETGKLYTCGDGRYGKTCSESESPNFISTLPTLITLFAQFQCYLVSCGGCQTMVLARYRDDFFDTENTKMISLPPLKMNKCLNENEGVESGGQNSRNIVNEEREDKQENPNPLPPTYDDLSVKRNDANNSNVEGASAYLDYISVNMNETETEESPLEEIKNLNRDEMASEEKSESFNENESDVIVRKESGMKKLLKLFRGPAIEKEGPEMNDKIGKVENGEKENGQTSRTCSII